MMLNGFPTAVSALVLSSFSTVVVYARIYCRRRGGSLSLFDHSIVLALELMKGGSRFEDVLLTWYIYRFAYPITLFIIKFSILLFYLHLAKTTHTTFRRVVYGTIILLSSYTITIVGVSIFACGKPSNGYSVREPQAAFKTGTRLDTCLDIDAIWFAQSGFNLLTDVVILILPMPMLLELHIPLHRKITLIATFSVGSIAVAAACTRVWLISEWSESFNAQAQYGYIMLIGGQIELNAGIVSACIPFLKPLFRVPKIGIIQKFESERFICSVSQYKDC